MSDPETMVQDLQTVFSRPWTELYAEGKDIPPDEIIDPIGIGHRGARIGEVETVCRDRDGTRWLRFTTRRALEKHDGIQVELPSGGKPFGFAVNAMRESGKRNQRPISLPVGTSVELLLPVDSPTLPVGSPVFCSASQAVRRDYEFASVRESDLSEDCGSDVASLDNQIAETGEPAQPSGDSVADRLYRCYFAGVLVDLRCPDPVSRFLAVHQENDSPVFRGEIDVEFLGEFGNRIGVCGIHAVFQALPGHDSV